MVKMNILDISSQLYTGKILLIAFSFFNIIINVFATYILMTMDIPLLALLSCICVVFNIIFFAISFKNWGKKDFVKVVV